MANILAGQRVRASDLNNNLPRIAQCTVTVAKTSNTTLGDVTGMVLSLAANAVYALDCYVAYNAGTTGDLKLAWNIPAGVTGTWTGWGPGTSATTGDTTINVVRLDAFGTANVLTFGGTGGLTACHPKGYVVVSSTAGNLQLQYAQNVSNGTATTIIAGSWMRLTRIL